METCRTEAANDHECHGPGEDYLNGAHSVVAVQTGLPGVQGVTRGVQGAHPLASRREAVTQRAPAGKFLLRRVLKDPELRDYRVVKHATVNDLDGARGGASND